MDFQHRKRYGSFPFSSTVLSTTTDVRLDSLFEACFDFETLKNLRFSSTLEFEEFPAEEELRRKGTLSKDEIQEIVEVARQVHENGI
jgi:hypothetical protein